MMARQPGMQRPYYYHVTTGETTWTLPPFPPPVPITKEPEKPKKKTKKPIPGTDWFLVQTPDGLEFYFHKPTKKSVWEIPEELKEPIEKMKQEALEQQQKELEQRQEEQRKEQQRLKDELEKEKLEREQQQQLQAKRKAEEEQEQEDVKRPKHDNDEEKVGEKQDEKEKDESQKDQPPETTEMTEEDLLYQLEGMDPAELEAMGMIPSDEEASQEQLPPPPSQQQLPPPSHMPLPPSEPSMTEEERVELFTQMLSEKEISPFSTWERELPKLINDERYALVQPLSKRKNLFNNFCRILVQEHKAKKPISKKSPEDDYMSLLKQEATVKMYWDDFRRKVKNDARFKAIRENKTREILFKDYIKKLRKEGGSGSGKDTSHVYSSQRDKQRAYMDLLKETKDIHRRMRWRDAKVILEKDDRYHAIDSKHLREDLYRDYLDDLDRKKR
ncbi:hypothetical protein BDA99DRAFT_493151 [Phascolomyces articulosus]|uniref:Transcription elongation regulator 1 n=1 Tax=Phascolomyces articulosus TaxID=60185 RepID=A0AAD5PKT3_9FUNG|nr:hypothetical protein BDA99DRAFT_493151 [Phascolomyces articulosus]